ncbi:PP2C family protein-serine/threonine phosphatase [Mycobacterium sp. pV006]|uniref:PP2C family protein-serine/threonine phosphatase n=1 Tax=Mycobacterium sp. pV006 TaxID=3238983 RepID=UPI00351B5396
MTGAYPPGHAEESFDRAPCGLLTATADRRIIAVNRTLADWLQYRPDDLLGRPFTELFSAGARIHYETHFAPLLRINRRISEFAVDLVAADRSRFPVLVSAALDATGDGSVSLIRMALHDARGRRSYERELLAERRRAEELTATLRRSLLPPSVSAPAGVEAAAHYHAATDDVTGDFYDLYPLAADLYGFFLGDVVGKGASAAMLTSLTRYTLRAAAVVDDDPGLVLHTLNTVLLQQAIDEGFVLTTVIVGTLRMTADGVEVRLAAGGHPPALLLRADGEVTEVDTRGGQAVGITAAASFVEAHLVLRPGDTLLLYTDGLTEARTGVGTARFDDVGGLRRFVAEHAPSSADGIIAALVELLADLGAFVEDDVALLAFGIPAPTT